MKPSLTTKLPKPADPSLDDWKITLWMDQATGDRSIEIEFPIRTGESGKIDVPLDLWDDPDAVRRKLRKKDANIPMNRKDANDFVSTMLLKVPSTPPNMKVAITGWHGKAFVTGDRVLGAVSQPLKLSDAASTHCRVVGKRGKFKLWKKRVAGYGRHSSYLTFGILVGLAAPMMAFAGLSEGAFFNFAGPGSSGKTTVSRAALSVFCDPGEVLDWNATLKSFEELAAAHNDMLLVFDDTEKAQQAALLESLDKVTHAIVSGKPKSYSTSYQGADALRRVKWRTFGMSSSPHPLEQYYIEARKKKRTKGQQLRMFDIPIENTGDARIGIFDLLDVGTEEAGKAIREILKDLEEGMAENYGVALPRWIRFLTSDEVRGRIKTLIDEFAEATRIDYSGPEVRLTSKFGLVYAAGVLGIEADILPWTVDHVMKAVRLCCERARRQTRVVVDPLKPAFQQLASKLRSKKAFPDFPESRTFSSKVYKAMLGFREKKGGKTLVAIQQDKLATFLNSELDARELLAELHKAGLGEGGHGGKKSVQREITVKRRLKNGRVKSKKRKPRFHVFRMRKLQTYLDGRVG